MSKKNKHSDRDFSKNRSKCPIDPPEVMNMEDIGYFSDEVLFDLTSKLESEKNQVASAGHDPYAWEVEIAYLHREQHLRNLRNKLHEEYMKTVGYEDCEYYESSQSFTSDDINSESDLSIN